MRLLLDTHALAWWLTDQSRLPPAIVDVIAAESDDVLVSIASAWEMAIKVGSGKWPEAALLMDNFASEVTGAGFRVLPISVSHVRMAGLMQTPHRDPFDRLLSAQAQIEGLTLVTSDARVQGLGARWIW